MKQFKIIGGLVLLMAAAAGSHAQNSKVQTAYNYYKYEEFDKAKEAIDAASTHEQSAPNPKTWVYRGDIYYAIGISKDPAVSALSEHALEESLNAYTKAKDLDDKGKYDEEIKRGRQLTMIAMYNKGAELFGAQKFAQSARVFQVLAVNNPMDTQARYNHALAAHKAGDFKQAKAAWKMLTDMQFPDPGPHQMLSGIYLEEGDTAQALKVLQSGRERFPQSQLLIIDEINIYLMQGRNKELENKLKEAISLEPGNATLHFALGTVYDNLEKPKLAEESYVKALEINPDYQEALYNLGTIYYNAAVIKVNEANALPLNKVKEYEAAKEEYMRYFNKALPYMERSYKLNDSDRNTVISLKEIYFRLGQNEKSNAMKKRLEEIK